MIEYGFLVEMHGADDRYYKRGTEPAPGTTLRVQEDDIEALMRTLLWNNINFTVTREGDKA